MYLFILCMCVRETGREGGGERERGRERKGEGGEGDRGGEERGESAREHTWSQRTS